MEADQADKTHSERNAKTVIVISAVCVCFAALGFVAALAIGGVLVKQKYKRDEGELDAQNLVSAVKAYEMEYSKLPLQDSWDKDFRVESDERLMDAFESPSRTGGPRLYKGGDARLLVVDPKLGPRLLDSWGRPYVLILDGDYDGFVTGPDGDKIHSDVICYSLGEDGVFDAKDPRSW